MKYNHKALSEIVGELARVASSNTISTAIRVRNNGELTVFSATDGELYLTVDVPCTNNTKTDILVNAKALDNVFRPDAGNGKDNIDFFTDSGNNKLFVIADGTKTGLIGDSDTTKFPGLPTIDGKWRKVADWNGSELSDVIKYAARAMCHDEARYNLNGLYLDGSVAVGTDGHRLNKVDLPSKISCEPLIIHGDMVRSLVRILDMKFFDDSHVYMYIPHGKEDEIKIEVAMSGVFFTLIAKRNSGEYPHFEQVIPSEHDYTGGFIADSATFKRCLARSKKMVGKTGNIILRADVGIDDSHVTLETKDYEAGETVTTVPVFDLGCKKPLAIGLNSGYVLDAINGSEKVIVMMIDELSPVTISPLEGNKLAVIMPVRI